MLSLHCKTTLETSSNVVPEDWAQSIPEVCMAVSRYSEAPVSFAINVQNQDLQQHKHIVGKKHELEPSNYFTKHREQNI